MTRIVDRSSLKDSKRVKLPDGYLKVPGCRLARTGIQTYLAGELGLTDRKADAVVKVWRPPEEVFSPASMASFSTKPVTDDHPRESVTADNARKYGIGWSGEHVGQDDIYLTADLLITDRAVIDKVEAGKSELSNGYDCELEWKSGALPTGETYDAIQRNIVGNHIAIVDAGRCGEACRVADGAPAAICDCGGKASKPEEPGSMPDLKRILVDGLQVETTDAGEAAITKLLGDKAALTTRLTTADATLATERAAWADAKSKLEAELATAKAAIPSGQALDALVTARTKLIGDAKRLAPALDASGKTDAEIRQAAVTGKLGDAAVIGKDAAFFTHAFDMLVIQLGDAGTGYSGNGGGPDPIIAAVASPAQVASKDGAWNEGVTKLGDAWKSQGTA